ncbi:DUF4058 family protein [Gemmata sp. JC673]|uniref:DUF4058 family protein n=1 Tax=Gemmata algarum TaxID=2975278 RepID=A0ABU5F0X2_9BACT|nr:DUF4058 family protein [Gemmata algarum]MDY3561228.1 DUF4058 family protein [Gemmata algarum]
MPLLDHFRSPDRRRLPWTTMSQAWAISLVRFLNTTLPRDQFQAVSEVRMGPQVEVDVAEYRLDDPPDPSRGLNGSGGTLTALVSAPPAVLTLSAIFPDEHEVEIRERRAGRSLVGVIELVSPRNKDRGAACAAFVAKCVAYLRRGVGVVIIDVVTERHANLHNALLAALGGQPAQFMPDTPTYVSGYRPVHRRETGANELEVWPYAAVVGQPVPVVPLGLRGGPVIVLDLETTYTAAIDATGL